MFFERFQSNTRMFISKKNINNIIVFSYNLGTNSLIFLKHSLGFALLSLIDVIGIDITKLKNYGLFFNIQSWQFPTQLSTKLIYYNAIDYRTSSRVIIATFSSHTYRHKSIETIFLNAGWLERELVEFFNIPILGRIDTRNLLLDYNSKSNPLLKIYPTEGHQELFFNYLSYNLEYVSVEFIEL